MGKGKPRIAIIGCGDAGLSAAFATAKRNAEVTIISGEKEYYPRCPLPYYIAGEIKRDDLVKSVKEMFKGTGVKVVLDRAEKIGDGKVVCGDCEVKYDKAIIATGANPKKIPGSVSLRTIEDADKMKQMAKKERPVIIGAGMLGCELADLLGGRLVECRDSILYNFDKEFSEIIAGELSKKAEIQLGCKKIPKSNFKISAVGVVPENEFAKKSRIKTGDYGIVVDNRLETSMKGVYAAGDCMEEKCFFTKKPMHSYLGPQSERQGFIAGLNALGEDLRYDGSLNAAVAKIGGYEIGVTGLCGQAAKEKGIDTTFGKIRAKSKPDYDKNAKELIVKMIFEGEKLVGCQAIGEESVEGIINLASYAMQHGATVDDLINLSYCYSPPICSAPNPVVLCAENARRRMRR
jgi:NADH oxidase (H2O2-forming)